MPPPNQRKDKVKSGDLTLLASQVKVASECHRLEQRVYKEICRREATPKPKADVWEIFAGEAEISKAAIRHNLKVMEPIDSIFGSTVENHRTKEIYDCLRRGGGIKFVVCFPLRSQEHPQLQLQLRSPSRRVESPPGKDSMADPVRCVHCKIQLQGGHYFLIENPANSRAWLEDPLLQLEKDPRVYTVVGHACAHNFQSIVEPGKFVRKAHRWMTNHPDLASFLERKCPDPREESGLHSHRAVEGPDTKHSGAYTPELAERASCRPWVTRTCPPRI